MARGKYSSRVVGRESDQYTVPPNFNSMRGAKSRRISNIEAIIAPS